MTLLFCKMFPWNPLENYFLTKSNLLFSLYVQNLEKRIPLNFIRCQFFKLGGSFTFNCLILDVRYIHIFCRTHISFKIHYFRICLTYRLLYFVCNGCFCLDLESTKMSEDGDRLNRGEQSEWLIEKKKKQDTLRGRIHIIVILPYAQKVKGLS